MTSPTINPKLSNSLLIDATKRPTSLDGLSNYLAQTTGEHRRSQKGPSPPPILENIVILCLERRYPGPDLTYARRKANSLVRLLTHCCEGKNGKALTTLRKSENDPLKVE